MYMIIKCMYKHYVMLHNKVKSIARRYIATCVHTVYKPGGPCMSWNLFFIANMIE